MSSEASIIADRLGLHIMASSPAGPYALWKPEALARREGPNIDALILAAAKSFPMNRTQMVAPFAEEELQSFKGRGNQTMTYIEDETVMDRLDVGYGYGNWQVHVEAMSESVVKVKLGVRESGEWIWYEDFGYPNREGGESLKEAVSDGIRRCGRYVGIARDLYRKSPDSRRDDVRPQRGPDPDPSRVDRETGEVRESAPFAASVEGKVQFSNKAPVDGNFRQTPEGQMYGFVVEAEGGKRLQVVVTHLADALQVAGPPVKGTWVTAEGLIERIGWKKDGKDMPPYQRMTLSRLTTPDYVLPQPKALEPDEKAELEALEVPWPDTTERTPA